MSFGTLTLLAPLTLIGLITLPLIWLILRISPPAPKRQTFPPLAILRGVETDEETPNSTPIWLLLFRLLIVALAIFALSLPVLTSSDDVATEQLTLIIDDSAASAPVWSDLMDDARIRLQEAQRNNADVVLLTSERVDTSPIPASEALQHLQRLQPQPILMNPEIADLPASRQTVFLSSGLMLGQGTEMTEALKAANALVVLTEAAPQLITPGDVRETADGFESDWTAFQSGASHSIEALSTRGDVLAVAPINFAPGQTLATASIALPPQLRAQIARLRVSGQRSSTSTKLLDDSFGRPLVGVLAPPSGTASPLLNSDFYAQQALEPFADIFIGDPASVLSLNPSVLVMTDAMSSTSEAIIDYVENGGLLVRFAGPQLAKSPDALIPVPLRQGGRSIGGALAWETPQKLAPFASETPFSGLAVPDDVTVSRQVMARPGAETDARTWARLEDGSPIVTSGTLGEGRLVLFHVTADPSWSNLALSGLYVDMLKRILPLAKTRRVITGEASDQDWVLDRALSPFGELRPPPPQTLSIADANWETSSAVIQPGYYRQGVRLRAANAVNEDTDLRRLNTDGLRVTLAQNSEPRSFAGMLLALALIMLSIDMIFSARVSGRAQRLWPSKAAAATLIAICLVPMMSPPPAHAQIEDRIIEASLGLHLGYIETGDARTDELSRKALESLSRQLTLRTTIEPVGVHGMAADAAGLELYPFLYWPVRLDTPALTENERVTLNRYIAAGGTLVIDTADEAERALRAGTPHAGLARATDGLNIGQLTTVPNDHVLTKSFYLMQTFPGRWAGGPVFVETRNATGTGRDGVSAVIIGSQDWAAGWAIDPDIGPLVELSRDIPRQREMSVRFGVNLAMYALSGNYKADQVHAADLIRRLGGAAVGPETSDEETTP